MNRKGCTKTQGTHARAPVPSLWLSPVQPHLLKHVFLKLMLIPTPLHRTLCDQVLGNCWSSHGNVAARIPLFVLQTSKKFFSLNILETNHILCLIWWGKGMGREINNPKVPRFHSRAARPHAEDKPIEKQADGFCVVWQRDFPDSGHKQVLSRIDFLIQLVSSQSTTT